MKRHRANVRQKSKTALMSHSTHAQQTFTHKRVINHNTCSIVKVEVHMIWLKKILSPRANQWARGE